MAEIKLIDAGHSLQIQKHVDEIVDGHPLWTSRFLISNPAVVVLACRDFIRAGSQIIRTNSYQATVDGFIKYMGLTREAALELIAKSVALTREAIQLENKVGQVEVAGSVGPYGASLHDGSEYRGGYEDAMSAEQLMLWHRDRVTQLVDAGVDMLAFETFPCTKEAVAIVTLLSQIPHVKAWISFSIKDEECISNGERFVDAVGLVVSEAQRTGCSHRLLAVGINCLDPKLVTPLLTRARAAFPHQPFIVYPNSGERYNTQLRRWESVEGMRPLSEFVKEWLDLGVRYIGGCCRATDQDLPAMWHQVITWQQSHK